MSMQTTTHLNFGHGEAREALEFYRSVFGGELTAITYDQMPGSDPQDAGKVIWGQVAADSGFRVMAYDVQHDKPYEAGVNPVYVSVRSSDPDAISAAWGPLSEGAEIQFPLGRAPWGAPLYGMLKDRFGVTWVLDVEVEHQG